MKSKQNLLSIYLFLLHLEVLIYSLFLSNDELFHTSYILYIVQYAGFLFLVYFHAIRLPLVLLLSPSFLALLYFELNFIVGSYYIPNYDGYVTLHYYNWASNYLNFHLITWFFLLCNYLVMLVFIQTIKKYHKTLQKKKQFIKKPHINKVAVISISMIILSVSLFFDKSISHFKDMAVYDFAYPYQLCAAIAILYLLVSSMKRGRHIYYIGLMIFFVIVSWDSKREIIFVALLIVFFESIYSNIKVSLNFRSISAIFAGFFLFSFIILWSSVLRGYGGYSDKSLFGSLMNVYNYVHEDYFSQTVLGNFELLNTYGDASNAIDGVLESKVDILYGMTFVKVLFAPVPRSLFPDKPKSMLEIYSSKFYPRFRARGGSMPIIIYSELFWNFHFLSVVAVYLLFLIVDYLYVKLIFHIREGLFNFKVISLLFFYATFTQFIRGAGIDIYVIYWLLAVPVILVISKVTRKKIHTI